MIKLAIVGLFMGAGSVGGVYNYTKLLLDNIDKNKFDLHYYSLGKSPNWYVGEDKPTLLKFGIILFIKMILFVFFLKNYKIEVVHLNSGLSQVSLLREGILAIIAKLVGCKTLFFIHGWKEKDYIEISEHKIRKKLIMEVLNKQDSIVVLASQFKKKLMALEIEEEKIFLSSTMVEFKKYKIEKKMFSKPFKILFCANIVREKGPYELLKSIPFILDKFSDIKFIFIGDGKDLKNLKSISMMLNINERISFTGYISQNSKIKIFKESHIFAYPTYYGEGFPTVILEAMAAGLPIITTSNAGLIDAIVNGREGFLLRTMPSKPKEIAEKIIRLIENPKLMKKMSNENIKRVKSEYDAKIVCNQVMEIYQKIHG
jgi:glycosyltransferase involved in cell wall biosynthesis